MHGPFIRPGAYGDESNSSDEDKRKKRTKEVEAQYNIPAFKMKNFTSHTQF